MANNISVLSSSLVRWNRLSSLRNSRTEDQPLSTQEGAAPQEYQETSDQIMHTHTHHSISTHTTPVCIHTTTNMHTHNIPPYAHTIHNIYAYTPLHTYAHTQTRIYIHMYTPVHTQLNHSICSHHTHDYFSLSKTLLPTQMGVHTYTHTYTQRRTPKRTQHIYTNTAPTP